MSYIFLSNIITIVMVIIIVIYRLSASNLKKYKLRLTTLRFTKLLNGRGGLALTARLQYLHDIYIEQ